MKMQQLHELLLIIFSRTPLKTVTCLVLLENLSHRLAISIKYFIDLDLSGSS